MFTKTKAALPKPLPDGLALNTDAHLLDALFVVACDGDLGLHREVSWPRITMRGYAAIGATAQADAQASVVAFHSAFRDGDPDGMAAAAITLDAAIARVRALEYRGNLGYEAADSATIAALDTEANRRADDATLWAWLLVEDHYESVRALPENQREVLERAANRERQRVGSVDAARAALTETGYVDQRTKDRARKVIAEYEQRTREVRKRLGL